MTLNKIRICGETLVVVEGFFVFFLVEHSMSQKKNMYVFESFCKFCVCVCGVCVTL